MIEIPMERIRCIECRSPVDESDPLDFGGGLACEPCIREYYTKQYSDCQKFYSGAVFDKKLESTIQEELGFRRRQGIRTLKEILKCHAKKQGRYR